MELNQVRYFVTLSRVLNFTRAAEQCNVTQPALTKGIRKLEGEMGGDLVHRERHLTQLTQLGKLVLPHFQAIIEAADKVRDQIRELDRGAESLRIGLTASVSASVVGHLIGQVTSKMPEVRIEVTDAPMAEIPGLLLEGEIEGAIAGDMPELPERLDQWKLFEENYVLLLPNGHHLAGLDPVPPRLLEQEVWLDWSEGSVLERFWRLHFGNSSPNIRHRASKDAVLVNMAEEGLGITLVPAHIPTPPRVTRRVIGGEALRHEVSLLAVAGRQHPTALEAFIKSTQKYGGSVKSRLRTLDDVV
ncbi:DNA-binding transcriptional LysR family regulator [Nitrobacteraceae bacterium AZCC 1564]